MKPNNISILAAFVAILGLAALLGCDRQAPSGGGAQTEPPPPKAVVAPVVVPVTNMIAVAPGTYLRGTQSVTISRQFWLGKYEVTQGEYTALTGKNPSHFQGDTNRPVEKISQIDASAYCSALTKRETAAGHLPPGLAYRLPTEAEWEYACRAGSTNLFSFGDDDKVADEYAWTLDNGEETTHPVGQKKPNAWGFHDMHGNVWEWCWDWFVPFPPTPATDPIGPPAGKFKVYRGGGWNHAVQFARTRNRFMMQPGSGIYFVGFRVALGAALPEPKPVPAPPPPPGAAQGKSN